MTEFARPASFERPPEQVVVQATEEECAALARRFGIPAVESLECSFHLKVEGKAVLAKGRLTAAVVQSCVVSLEPVAQRVTESFILRFVPAGTERDDLDPDLPDEMPVEGSMIDLGEAAAEQLALALDPYPRLEDALLDPAATDAPVSPFELLRRKS